ncbi:prealbumin-like fold domain-containing protein [Ligilactobacillus salivarius]|uniref:Gram-positive cocci surface proteins LPxTG domain-containing protein n=1 Tax=Ligilactobacillus salivarius TaxID=1624 RepID=A0A2U2M2D9_9LACO|nr:prealbumin-like fold domain-containing protein [Ligilactobacillus salivarius]PWG51029.1 hypothetical protein DB362_09300 [Ligilactobacillus salivarius]
MKSVVFRKIFFYMLTVFTVFTLLLSSSANVLADAVQSSQTTSSTISKVGSSESSVSNPAPPTNSASTSSVSDADATETNKTKLAASSHTPSDISNRITGLTVVDRDSGTAKGQYTDGNFLSVRGTFSDRAGKILGGDYIKVAWPTSGQAIINGFNGQKDLYIDGINVGIYRVDANGATLTFNDNINNLSNVHGDFSFDVQVRNFSSEDQSISINSGSAIVRVNTKGVTGGEDRPTGQGWRGSKVGNLSNYQGENTIRWGIYLNSERARLDKDIVVDDTMQGGQELKKDRITVIVDRGRQLRLADFLNQYPKSSATVEDNKIHFNFNAKEFSGHGLAISYTTVITDNDLSNFDNSAIVSYKLVGEEAKTVTYNKSVQNASFDASVTGTEPGELKIIKKVSGKDQVLPGVKFKITYPSGKEIYETTNNSGIIDIKNLPAGTYKAQEVSAPDWIDVESVKDKVYEIRVSASEKGRALVVYNTPKRTKRDTDSIPWTDYSNNKAKTVIPWTDYSNNKAKIVIPWTDYSNNKAKIVIPWTDYSNNKAKEVIPWTDYSNNKAKEVIPWTDYSNNKAKVVIPWTDYSNNKAKIVIPWTDYSNNKAKVVIPWTDYSNNKAKVVIPWTDYSNNKAKEVIPWTDYSNNKAKEVIPWTDYSNNKAKEVIPWTPLTPAKEVKPWVPLKPSTTVIPWTELTTAESSSEPKQEASSTKNSTNSSSISSSNSSTSSSISSASSSERKQAAKKGNFLPQTGEKSTMLISIVGVALIILSIVIILNRRKENK